MRLQRSSARWFDILFKPQWVGNIAYTPGDLQPPKSLATLDEETVDPEITVKLEMRDVLKVHDAQT